MELSEGGQIKFVGGFEPNLGHSAIGIPLILAHPRLIEYVDPDRRCIHQQDLWRCVSMCVYACVCVYVCVCIGPDHDSSKHCPTALLICGQCGVATGATPRTR